MNELPLDEFQCSGAIVPVMVHPENKELYVMLGEEVRLYPSGKVLEWSEFGGGRIYTDPTIEETAVREFSEECGGVEDAESLKKGNYLARICVPLDKSESRFKTYFIVRKPWDATACKRYNKMHEELKELCDLCKKIRKERSYILDRNRTAALPFVDQTFRTKDNQTILVTNIAHGSVPKTIEVTGKTMAGLSTVKVIVKSEDYNQYIDYLRCINIKRAQCPELWEQGAVE